MIQPSHMAVVVAAVACISDWRSHRIPNALTFTAAFAAIGCHALLGGGSAAGNSVMGWLLGMALFFPFFALGGLGAGDVKLLGAIGAWIGPSVVLRVAMYSAMAGGVLAVVLAVRSGYLRIAFRNIRFLIEYWSTVGFKPAEGLTLTQANAPKLAYAFPIFTGLVVTLWLR